MPTLPRGVRFGAAGVRRLPRSWGSYWIIATVWAFNAVQISLTPPLLATRDYAPALIGTLVSALAVASVLARLPAGACYRRDRAKGIQAVGIVVLAGALVSQVYAAQPAALLLVRLVAGLAFSVVTTFSLARFIDEQPPGPARARALGLYTGGGTVGFALGSWLIGFAVDAWGYEVAFVGGGLVTALGLVGLLDRTAVVEETEAPQRVGVGVVLRSPILQLLVVEAFLLNAHWAFWNGWLAIFGLAVGFTLAQVGILRTANALLSAIGRPVGGVLLMRWHPERVAVFSMVALCGLLALVPALPIFAVLVPLFAVMGALRAVAFVANMVAVVKCSEVLGLVRGQTSALFYLVTDLGVLAGPLAGGLLAEALGPEQIFVAMPALMLAVYGVSRLLGRGAAPAPVPSVSH
jgi:predicted MFS family arabinose efflux permease